jgi:hypothetical protein
MSFVVGRVRALVDGKSNRTRRRFIAPSMSATGSDDQRQARYWTYSRHRRLSEINAAPAGLEDTDELSWTLHHDRDLLVIDKPAFVVCIRRSMVLGQA